MAPMLATELDDGHGQRRALCRIGAGAQLVEEHQRIGCRTESTISTMFFMCEEKVDRDCSMDCSSPISA